MELIGSYIYQLVISFVYFIIMLHIIYYLYYIYMLIHTGNQTKVYNLHHNYEFAFDILVSFAFSSLPGYFKVNFYYTNVTYYWSIYLNIQMFINVLSAHVNVLSHTGNKMTMNTLKIFTKMYTNITILSNGY